MEFGWNQCYFGLNDFNFFSSGLVITGESRHLGVIESTVEKQSVVDRSTSELESGILWWFSPASIIESVHESLLGVGVIDVGDGGFEFFVVTHVEEVPRGV